MSKTLPSSLIILKHSIVEGRVPTPENLKAGALAITVKIDKIDGGTY